MSTILFIFIKTHYYSESPMKGGRKGPNPTSDHTASDMTVKELRSDQVGIVMAKAMDKQVRQRLWVATLGHISRREIVSRAPKNAKLRDKRKAWKDEGRALKMTVGTGFPSILSYGRWRRDKDNMKVNQKMISSTNGPLLRPKFLDMVAVAMVMALLREEYVDDNFMLIKL